MLHDIVDVRPLGGYRLFLKFDDGTEGEIDLSTILRFDGVFQPMIDPAVFAAVRVDPEIGTIVWPNGADLCPDALYSLVHGVAVPGTSEQATV